MINTGSSGQFFSLLNNRFFVICQQFLFLMVWGVSFRLCSEHPVQAFRLCPTPFFVSGEYVSPLRPERRWESGGHDKAYNILFHPVKE